jgi:hypothetical protein
MSRFLIGLSVILSVWVLSPTPQASAWSFWSWWSGGHSSHNHDYQRTWSHDKTGHGVPELDPGAAGSAMVLLLGGAAFVASRRREKDLA